MSSKDGCVEFQQQMFNRFGDRDYDSFDFQEFRYLEEKIGYALYGPCKTEIGYDDTQKKKIKFIMNIVVKESNLINKWKDRIIISVIFNCMEPLPKEKRNRARTHRDYKPECDFNPTPVFVLRKCKNSKHPCRVFIDDTGRVYQSWKEYLTENKAPKCNMVLPMNGKYQANNSGEILLERYLSPACRIDTEILEKTDIATAIGGVASGGIFIAAAIPTITVAPFALIAAGAAGIGIGTYSIGRSIYSLYDRKKHKEDMGLANSESRGAYLNILAGTMSFAGAGANIALSQLASRGVNMGNGAKTAFNFINVANLGASGISVANASYDVLDQLISEKKAPTSLSILQLTSSIFFFGHAVYNFQSTNAIIKKSQASSLRKFLDSLQSNRHRRTFNELVRETIRQNKGNVELGQAQVIKTLRNMNSNKNQVFDTLNRWNKEMKDNKVKFAVKDGRITLNGVVIDITEFGKMDRDEVIAYLEELPRASKVTHSEINVVKNLLKSAFGEIELEEVGDLAFGVFKILGNEDLTTRQKIINAVAGVVTALSSKPVNYIKWLDTIFPHHLKYFKLIGMVNVYLKKLVSKVEKKYQAWLATRDPSLEEPYFITLSLNIAKRMNEIFSIVTKAYFIATNLTELGLKELLNYFHNWFTEQVYLYQENKERKRERIRHSNDLAARKVNCPKCNGTFYNRQLLYR